MWWPTCTSTAGYYLKSYTLCKGLEKAQYKVQICRQCMAFVLVYAVFWGQGTFSNHLYHFVYYIAPFFTTMIGGGVTWRRGEQQNVLPTSSQSSWIEHYKHIKKSNSPPLNTAFNFLTIQISPPNLKVTVKTIDVLLYSSSFFIP